jgi:hypothetical protein
MSVSDPNVPSCRRFTPFYKRVILLRTLCYVNIKQVDNCVYVMDWQIERVMTQLSPEYGPIIDQLADSICRRGWRLPALIALEAGRPLAFLGGQLLWVAQPALSLLLPSTAVRQVAALLEEPAAVHALAARLEEA